MHADATIFQREANFIESGEADFNKVFKYIDFSL